MPPKRQRTTNKDGRIAAVELISAAITLPQAAPPMRYRDITTSTKTALARGFSRTVADWVDAPTSGSMQVASQTWIAFLFRSVLRCIVLLLQSGVANGTAYQWYSQFSLTANIVVEEGTSGPFPIAYAKNSAGTAYHGTYLYPGVFKDGKRWLWCDQGTLTVNNTTTIPATSAFYITLWRWNNGDPIQVQTTDYVAGTVSTNSNFTTAYDYYAITYNSQTTTVTPGNITWTVTWVVANGKSVFAHLSFPNLDTNQTRVTGARIIGNALLISNTSADQYKAGSWAGLQLGKGDAWTNYIGSGTNNNSGTAFDPFAKLSLVKNVAIGSLKNGMYGYHKPVSQDDFMIDVPFQLGLNQALVGCNGFDMEDSACILCITAPTGSGTLSHSMQLSWDVSMEFTTEDMWTMVEAAGFDPDEWEKALMIISSMAQFYENPIHWRAIVSTIGKLAHVSAPIISVFGPYGKILGTALTAIGAGAGAIAPFLPE